MEVPIRNFETSYRVSSDGKIISLPRKGSHSNNYVLQHHKDRKGYHTVCLNSKPIKQVAKVHRLVAEHFITKPLSNEKLQVNHKDGNKNNNDMSNLEWVTCKENIRHSWANNLHTKSRKGVNNTQSKLDDDKVRIIRKRILTGETLQSIAKDYSVNFTLISLIKRNKIWTHVK